MKLRLANKWRRGLAYLLTGNISRNNYWMFQKNSNNNKY